MKSKTYPKLIKLTLGLMTVLYTYDASAGFKIRYEPNEKREGKLHKKRHDVNKRDRDVKKDKKKIDHDKRDLKKARKANDEGAIGAAQAKLDKHKHDLDNDRKKLKKEKKKRDKIKKKSGGNIEFGSRRDDY